MTSSNHWIRGGRHGMRSLCRRQGFWGSMSVWLGMEWRSRRWRDLLVYNWVTIQFIFPVNVRYINLNAWINFNCAIFEWFALTDTYATRYTFGILTRFPIAMIMGHRFLSSLPTFYDIFQIFVPLIIAIVLSYRSGNRHNRCKLRLLA